MRITQLRGDDGTVVCARCTVASSPLARMRGLLGRSSLAPDEGMLFTRTGSIHMFFMRFAIDVVFCDGDLQVLKVVPDLPPWRTAAARGAKVTIELPVGGAAGLEPGDRLVLDDEESLAD
ncbi:MAG TPA: DUF192 domain-containing protein [Gaiellaceae bacterium]|nr:DUF192 domain-containing protein [Gaiellaceae bacterium]